jgi:membrane-associated phospholipid phosphatase
MTEPAHQTMDIKSRLMSMSLGWGSVGLVYFSTWSIQGHATMLQETLLDRLIPYNPIGIWLYLSFFILIPYTYLSADHVRVRWLARAMPLCAAICGAIFLAFPTTLHYPSVGDATVSEQVLRLLLSADTSQNCFPSLHAALTLLCVWALVDVGNPKRSILAVVLGVGICYSIIQLRRHIGIDLMAGLLTGFLCGCLCSAQFTYLRKNREAS